MVSVTNGIETFVIPEGAVKVYKNMGFRPVKSVKTAEVKAEEPDVPVEATDVADGEAVDIDELLTKPISQWNQNEVKEFAAAKGYDVSGAKSLKQAKSIIKEALEVEERALAEE